MSKKVEIKKTVRKKLSQRPVATNIKPIELENVSIEELCIMEMLSEESEKAGLEGSSRISLTCDRLDAKVAEKLSEKKQTGKVSTFLTQGS